MTKIISHILLLFLFSNVINTSAQTSSYRNKLDNLYPFWEFLEKHRQVIEEAKGIKLVAQLEYWQPYIQLNLSDTTGQLFYRVHYQVENELEITQNSFYCADLELSSELAPATLALIEFFSWDSIPESQFPLGQKEVDYLKIAGRIAEKDDHHGTRETIHLTQEELQIWRSNHWNAKSLDHKDSYFLTDLKFIISLTDEHPQDTLLPYYSTMIGDMEVNFSDGSATTQTAYGENISESIASEKENYDQLFHFSSPNIQTLLAASKPIHDQTFKLKFLLRVLPDNGWFLKFYNDGHYEYIHWSAWRDDGGLILEQGAYTITNNRILLEPDSDESEFTHYTFYLVTTKEDIDNNFSIDCKDSNGTTYCLYRVYGE